MKYLLIILFSFIYFSSFSQVEKNFDIISIGINSSTIDLEEKIENFINEDSTIKINKALEISGDFIKIPDCIYKFYWIEELIINSTKPIVINKSINKFENLENLKVLTEIKYISDEISLKKLKRIDFDYYKSCIFPNFIIQQKELEYLKIENSNISEIPKEISNCKNLKIILLHNSKIKHLPITFYNLKNLEILGVCSNPIKIDFVKLLQMDKLKEVYIDADIKCNQPTNINFIACE